MSPMQIDRLRTVHREVESSDSHSTRGTIRHLQNKSQSGPVGAAGRMAFVRARFIEEMVQGLPMLFRAARQGYVQEFVCDEILAVSL